MVHIINLLHLIEVKRIDTLAGQTLQAEDCDDPISALYVPGAQSLQVEMASAPTAVENVPTPQFSHVVSFVAPVLVLYFPAAHEWQPLEIL